MPLCVNVTFSLCITMRDLATKSFYIDVSHLSCKAALSMFIVLRDVAVLEVGREMK